VGCACGRVAAGAEGFGSGGGGGAQQPLGPKNPLKSIEFNGPDGG